MAAAPTPREVLLATIRAVIDGQPDSDFVLVESRPYLRRQSGDFTHRIEFQGFHSNGAGLQSDYEMSVNVSSRKLKAWQKSQLFCVCNNPSEYLCGWKVGDPYHEDRYMWWELGPYEPDSGVIARMRRQIFTVCIPWAIACETPANFPRLGLQWSHALEFISLALMQGDNGVATDLASWAVGKMLEMRERCARRDGSEPFSLDFGTSVPDLLSWHDTPRNLRGLILLHKLDVEWPE